MNRVDILLSTYNGEAYVDELIESVMNQTYANINLIIRDDGSKDGTIDKVKMWKNQYPYKITLIEDDRGNLGVTRSMFALLKESKATYTIFCDQDDVWFKDKVEWLVKGIKIKEREYPNIPIIVHCEAITTDSKLKPVHKDEKKALHAYQTGRNKMQTSFTNLLLSNPVQGASMIFNNKLKELLVPVVDEHRTKSVVYDSLVASVCSIKGKVFFMNKPLMYYRQHARNVVGAARTSLLHLNSYNDKQKDDVLTANNLVVNRKKCDLLEKYYKNEMSEHQRAALKHFMERPNDWREFFKLGLKEWFSMKQVAVMIVWGVK